MRIITISLLLGIYLLSQAQSDILALIPPTGMYSVGTISYEWNDNTRTVLITSHQKEKRTIVVQIWYPAEMDSNAVSALYAGLSEDYRHVTPHSYLRTEFNNEVEKSPLIFLALGRGTERFLYTSIAEELASHGYVVAAVDMPQIGSVKYSDGYVIKPSDKYKPPRGMMGGPYEKVDKFFEEPTAIGIKDLEFAYRKILDLIWTDSYSRFYNKINTDDIGIFAHSLGGRIAGAYTAKHEHVKAYISMEGIPPREVRYEGKINIPIVMMCSSGTWPYAKENYFSLIDNRSNSVFMIELADFGHNSLTDNPFIFAESREKRTEEGKRLIISREIILNYFDFIFKGKQPYTPLKSDSELIKTTEYKK